MPDTIGSLYEFWSSDGFGAILLTKAPVVRKGLYGSIRYKNWVHQNNTALLERWPEIENYGLIVITSTYGTQEANINAWKNKSKTIHVGFKSAESSVLEIAPSSEWYKAPSDEGWIESKAENVRIVYSTCYPLLTMSVDR
jgi:uncharacterized protein with WD repeat